MGKKWKGSDPRCWWCHKRIELGSEWRGHDKSLDLPPVVGVIVCGPDCKEKPEGAMIYTHQSLTGI